jgi:hypothetical protein
MIFYMRICNAYQPEMKQMALDSLARKKLILVN